MRGFKGGSYRLFRGTSEESWGVRGGLIAIPPRWNGIRRAHHRLQACDQAPPKA